MPHGMQRRADNTSRVFGKGTDACIHWRVEWVFAGATDPQAGTKAAAKPDTAASTGAGGGAGGGAGAGGDSDVAPTSVLPARVGTTRNRGNRIITSNAATGCVTITEAGVAETMTIHEALGRFLLPQPVRHSTCALPPPLHLASPHPPSDHCVCRAMHLFDTV